MNTTVLDVFCGAGGFSQGFSEAGCEVVAGIDIDDDALATFEANHDAPGHNIDLSETEPESVLEAVGTNPDDIDVVVGGPPCQGFSRAGDRDPGDERNTLVDAYLNLVSHIQPDVFVMENVKGLLSMQDGEVIDHVTDRINAIGYNAEYAVLNAADYGVPQTRRRLILIAARDCPGILPDPTHADDRVPLADILDEDARTEDGDPYLVTSPSGDSYQVHGRDDFRTTEDPAFTHTGRYARLIPPNFEPNEDATPAGAQHRRLTRAESARIQSFDDDFEWRGNGVMRQQGNAVPPALAQRIAHAVHLTEYHGLKARLREDTTNPSEYVEGQTALAQF